MNTRTAAPPWDHLSVPHSRKRLKVQGSGFSVQCSGFRVQGFRFQGSVFWCNDLEIRLQSLSFRVQGSGHKVEMTVYSTETP